MFKSTFTLFMLVIVTFCYGQKSQTKYYSSEWLTKEVDKGKAKFSKTVIENPDSTKTTIVKDLKRDAILWSTIVKGKEPYGTWTLRTSSRLKTLDYNFPLVYSDVKCSDTVPVFTTDYFRDHEQLRYQAPQIEAGKYTVYEFISLNLCYPKLAVESNIQGTVYLNLTLTKDGRIEDIVVQKGVHPLLDKEAVRILRFLKFSSPPMLNGQPTEFKCLTLPMKFMLE